MDNWQSKADWFRRRFPNLPSGSRDMFLRDTGRENLLRLKGLSVIMTLIAAAFLFMKLGEPYQTITFGFCAVGFISFLIAKGIERSDSASNLIIRLPVLAYSLVMIWWSAMIGSLDPLGISYVGYFMLSLFVLYSLFLNAPVEVFLILVNGIGGLLLFDKSGPASLELSSIFGYLLVVLASLMVAGILYHNRVVSFLSWENLTQMNQSLKREVAMHNSTLLELESAKNHLDRQVTEKTRDLRETLQQLQEEIAERNYSDKIKTILYRISSHVNGTGGLEEMFSYIKEQLSQILDVSNLMIGIYDEESHEIRPAFQVNGHEPGERYRLGRSLSSYIIRNRKSLLIDRKGIHELAVRGEIEAVGVPADSWLGVPLMVESGVVGILMVQSFDKNCRYDKSDLQLLEYVGEHLALAIDRHETEAKLIRAKEQAEESDRLKSSFLANLSHEVRTPMNAIVGFAELLSEPDLEKGERVFYSSQVLENGQKLLNTLTNMVELAKIQSKQMPFEVRELSVKEALSPQMGEFVKFKSIYNKQAVEVVFKIDEDVTEVGFMADRDRFQQLFSCLAENAIKFTHQGSVEVGCQRYDGRNLLFWVKDTGIGMTPKEINQVFNWFTKGQNPSERVYRGTGLGLTITKLILENMKGRIWVESEPGQGSCFYFTLPTVQAPPIRLIPRITKRQSKEDDIQASVNAG